MKEYIVKVDDIGTKYWYLNGEELTEEEFNKRTQVRKMSIKEIQDLLGYKVEIIE